MQESKRYRFAGKERGRTGGIQDRTDAKKEGFKTGGRQERRVQDMRYAEEERCW